MAPGTRLGPYEIVALAGSGGMGEVYRARDTRLDRTVAIKVLPARLGADADLRVRFEREARAISALDHPNICPLFDVGRSGDVDFLVMPFIDGETLAQRLARGPLPIADALRYGIEIASALDRAHRAGILHRDLKPGNVMLTKSGAKLLDFGLAKLGDTVDASPGTVAATASSPLTGKGTMLGTLLYMSPEQLQGGPIDARSDIFSFGAVLYEMVTGARAFEGQSQASVIAAILERDPLPITERAPLTPVSLDRVVRKCLAKDRDERWQSARDLADELSWIAQGSGTSPMSTAVAAALPPRGAGRFNAARVVAVLSLILAALLVVALKSRPAAVTAVPRHLTLTLPEGVHFVPGGLAISPDGRTIAFIAAPSGAAPSPAAGAKPAAGAQKTSFSAAAPRIYLRRFDEESATPIAGTEGARAPFFSPDGLSIGYFTPAALMRVSVLGGAPIRVVETPPVTRGGAWGPDDVITYTPTQSAALARVASSGATGLQLDAGAEAQLWPEILPGGTHVVYSRRSAGTRNLELADVVIRELASKEERVLVQGGSYARYSPTGHLLFVRGGTLIAIPFDLSTKQTSGTPLPVVEGIAVTSDGGAHYAVGADGTIVVLRGSFALERTTASWVDRGGRELRTAGEGLELNDPRISPDGRRALIGATTSEGDDDVYLMDLLRNNMVRFTNEPSDEFNGIWTPDSKAIIYTMFAVGTLPTLVMKLVDVDGAPEILVKENRPQFAGSVSRDRLFAYTTINVEGSKGDVVVVPLDGERKPRPFLNSKSNEYGAEFSPDGRWIAYISDESGTEETYVAPYPGPGQKRRLSNGGGLAPAWCARCNELYFQSATGIMVVTISSSAGETIFGEPRLLFADQALATYSREDGSRQYDVTPDGKQFLVLRSNPGSAASGVTANVLIDWVSRLTRRSAPGG